MLCRCGNFFRCLCVLAVTAVFFLFAVDYAFADDLGECDSVEKEAVCFAQNFADSVCFDGALRASDPVVLRDDVGGEVGWVVSYFNDDGNSSGYIVLDRTVPGLISEYSFEIGARLVDPHGARAGKAFSADHVYIKSDSCRYEMIDLDTGEYTSNYGEMGVLSEEELNAFSSPDSSRSANYSDWSEIFFDNLMGNYAVSSTGFINSPPIFFSQQYSVSQIRKYACAVNALCCVSLYLGVSDYSSVLSDYSSIWSRTKTRIYKSENGIDYGSTTMDDIGSGFYSFAQSKGATIRYDEHFADVPFAFFKNAIDAGGIAVFGCTVKVSGSVSGHAMCVEGYQELCLRDKSSRAAVFAPDVLIVSDGWHEYPRYINLASIDWNTSMGTAFYR